MASATRSAYQWCAEPVYQLDTPELHEHPGLRRAIDECAARILDFGDAGFHADARTATAQPARRSNPDGRKARGDARAAWGRSGSPKQDSPSGGGSKQPWLIGRVRGRASLALASPARPTYRPPAQRDVAAAPLHPHNSEAQPTAWLAVAAVMAPLADMTGGERYSSASSTATPGTGEASSGNSGNRTPRARLVHDMRYDGGRAYAA